MNIIFFIHYSCLDIPNAMHYPYLPRQGVGRGRGYPHRGWVWVDPAT